MCVVHAPTHCSVCAHHPFALQAVAPRLSWVAGNFFSLPGQLPGGDLVVLGRILHDWEEARCRKLIKTIYDKLPVGKCCMAHGTILKGAECMISDRHRVTRVTLRD
jgi:hypothetical protein